ncbi:hypothetical protein AB0B45_44070 [Nonomuraea sp. NPDC049152]|uniref:hypothetical protein n=1 Tax=Nonomuraea sp. NPDC049152 TaxID=3154350 RepID=UPI0033E33153
MLALAVTVPTLLSFGDVAAVGTVTAAQGLGAGAEIADSLDAVQAEADRSLRTA